MTLPFAHSDSFHSRRNASHSEFVPQSPGAVSILLLWLRAPWSCRLEGSSERAALMFWRTRYVRQFVLGA